MNEDLLKEGCAIPLIRANLTTFALMHKYIFITSTHKM